MNIKTAAQIIRDSVDMNTVLSLYGYRANRSGFLCCPFHGEREGSLKVYPGNGGWNCFGCGRGGSVIDFVMEHENCDFRTAVIAIDNALNMGMFKPNENAFDAARQRNLQQWLDIFVKKIFETCDLMIDNIDREQAENYRKMVRLENLRYWHIDKLTKDDWSFLMSYDENDEYDDYRKEKILELKEEVAEWRRKYRRTG